MEAEAGGMSPIEVIGRDSAGQDATEDGRPGPGRPFHDEVEVHEEQDGHEGARHHQVA